jgi:ketosteroid isomerase-like protein
LRLQERFECWNRGEFDMMLEPYAEDVVFDLSAVFTDVGPIRGHQNIRDSWSELRETWDGLLMDPLDLFDVGDGQYVLEVRLWGRGRRSGVEVDQRFAFLYTLRPDGKVVYARLLPDAATAFAAAESSAAQTT